jgi:hypothetical protein
MQALAIAAAGMSAAANRLGASAERVATWDARETDTDLAKEAVEQISAKNDFKANAAVIKTADEMIGALDRLARLCLGLGVQRRALDHRIHRIEDRPWRFAGGGPIGGVGDHDGRRGGSDGPGLALAAG